MVLKIERPAVAGLDALDHGSHGGGWDGETFSPVDVDMLRESKIVFDTYTADLVFHKHVKLYVALNVASSVSFWDIYKSFARWNFFL